MRTVFKTPQAKHSHTAKDFEEFLESAPAKNFFFGFAFAVLTAVVTQLLNAARSLGVMCPPPEKELDKHKRYIKKVMSRMRSATRHSDDSTFASAVISNSNPAEDCKDFEQWCHRLLACHIEGTKLIEGAIQHGARYGPDKGHKDQSRKDSIRPSNPSTGDSDRKNKKPRYEEGGKDRGVAATAERAEELDEDEGKEEAMPTREGEWDEGEQGPGGRGELVEENGVGGKSKGHPRAPWCRGRNQGGGSFPDPKR